VQVAQCEVVVVLFVHGDWFVVEFGAEQFDCFEFYLGVRIWCAVGEVDVHCG